MGWLTDSAAGVDADEAEGAPLLTPALMARVRQIQIRTHRLVNTALAGGYRSTFRGQGVEFEEVRPYQPGDEVRAIDWNVTARTGQPFVKSYREERQLTIHLLVDTALPMDFATFGETKRDAASQLAALIAFVAVRHQDRVGLTLFGAEPGLHLDPGRQSRPPRATRPGVVALRCADEAIGGAAGPGQQQRQQIPHRQHRIAAAPPAAHQPPLAQAQPQHPGPQIGEQPAQALVADPTAGQHPPRPDALQHTLRLGRGKGRAAAATIFQLKHAISVYEFWRGLPFPSAIVGGKRDPLRAKYTLGTYYGHFVARVSV